ncbi:MAG: zinc ribbon domain-containing protein [Rugosibacter sp.]|nr:zinc ribbon domain-containing protein [Rugosibacter sp.]
MPIYAYRCTQCGFEKEVMQKISDPLLTTCPACQAETFAKQLTAPGFQLKGSGWYATDFKGGNKSSATEVASSPTPASTTNASSPASATPATPAAPTTSSTATSTSSVS